MEKRIKLTKVVYVCLQLYTYENTFALYCWGFALNLRTMKASELTSLLSVLFYPHFYLPEKLIELRKIDPI